MIDYFELFSSNNLDGREIAIKLSQMYDTKSNKSTYLSQYNSFKRSSTETVENSIERLKTILAGIEQHKRPGERKQDPEIYLRHHIKKMVPPKIWDQIEKEETENLRDGRPMTINQMANRLDIIEERNMEKAMPDSMIHINSISRPTQNNSDSRNTETNSHSHKYETDKFQRQDHFQSNYQPKPQTNPHSQNYENYGSFQRQNQFQTSYQFKPQTNPHSQNYENYGKFQKQNQFQPIYHPNSYNVEQIGQNQFNPRNQNYYNYTPRPYNQGYYSNRGNYFRPYRGTYNSNRGYYQNNYNPTTNYRNFKPIINSAVKEAAEGRPPTPIPTQTSSWDYENKKRSSNYDRNPKRFQGNFKDHENKSTLNSQQSTTENHQGTHNIETPFKQQSYQQKNPHSSTQNDNIWDDNPKQNQWEHEVARPEFGRENYRENYRGNYRGNYRNFRRGQNGRFRGGRPFVKYISRQQILYDQTCQNADCQIPGQFVHHQDDCPKSTEKDKKDFQ